MAKYRKKPVVIDAWLFDGSWKSARPIVEHNLRAEWSYNGESHNGVIAIETPEGTMRALPGDYVIRGVEGEFYPCKPDIFMATYDLA
jgi:hypothetical protein